MIMNAQALDFRVGRIRFGMGLDGSERCPVDDDVGTLAHEA